MLTTFAFNSTEVRTITKDGEPWFVAKDVCTVLGLTKYRDAIARLDADEKRPLRVDTLGGKQAMTIISESGLYELIGRSDKPAAKDFRRWVRKEVLPTIRKTGSFNGKFVPATREQMRQYALEELAEAMRPTCPYGSLAKDGRQKTGFRSPTFTVKGRPATAKLVAAMRMQLELPLLANAS